MRTFPDKSSDHTAADAAPHWFVYCIVLGTGGLLSLMVQLNGTLARFSNSFYSSWVAHGTGMIAAFIILVIVRKYRVLPIRGAKALPFWAYLGGIAGAITVILTSHGVNSPVGLAGTLALGLVGQAFFGLIADRFGLLGLPKRPLRIHDFAALCLVLMGSMVILFSRTIG